MKVAWGLFWEGSWGTKLDLAFFRVKWLQRAMTGSSCLRRVPLRSSANRSSLVFCNVWLFMCVWLRGVLEPVLADRSVMAAWHQSLDCCLVLLPCAWMHAGLPRDAAKRIVMAAWRFLAAASVCITLLSFAAEGHESYWSGCIKVVIVICQKIFSILALVIFLLKILFKKWFKIVLFSALAPRSGFGAAI